LTANNNFIREFAHLLAHHALKVRVLNGCNLTDEAVGTEGWAREAAEILLRRRFFCSNILSAQQDTFDIHGGKTIIQVTSNLRTDKVQHTLETYEKNGHRSTYPRLVIFLIGEKPVYKKTDFSKLKLGFRFSPEKQVVGIKELVRAATRLRLDELRKLLEVTRAYLGNETPGLINIEYLHEQCKDFQRELESCRTIVHKAIKKMKTFAIVHPPSAAKLPVSLEAFEKFETLIQSWSNMVRSAALTSGQSGRDKIEAVSRTVAGQHLSLIQSRAQFERIAESIMDGMTLHRMITQKELIGTLEADLQRTDEELESARFAEKFLSGT
jgi:hypothetical protein